MMKSKSLILAAVLGAALASPSFALEMGADTRLMAVPADMSGMTMVEGSAFVGNEVRTKDQVVIGQVDSVYTDAAGEQMIVIALNIDVAGQSSVKSFIVPMAADTTADGSLTLGWTESDLFVNLSSNLGSATESN